MNKEKICLKTIKILNKKIINNIPGFEVEYPDQVIDWIPKSIIDEYYFDFNNVPFGIALEYCKKGYPIRLVSWDENLIVRTQSVLINSDLYYLVLCDNNIIINENWVPSKFVELLSDDWQILEKNKL